MAFVSSSSENVPPSSLPPTEFEALRRHLLEHSVKRGDFVLKSGRR